MTLKDEARREMDGFGGELIGPQDTTYEEARAVYNGMIDRHPGVIARAVSDDDVAAVISFAREHDVLLAVCGGSHNGGGLGTCDEGIVLDRELARFLAGEITVEQALQNVYDGWEEITEEFGRDEQLKLYKASLGITN